MSGVVLKDHDGFCQKTAQAPRQRQREATQKKVQSALKELQALTKKSIPEDKRSAAMPLIHNLAFMRIKLEQARSDLMADPLYIEYDNGGGQSGLREHPGYTAYNKLFTTYARALKQLTDLMPEGATEADELEMYVTGGRL